MITISVEEAQSKLSELIRKLELVEEVVITENNIPVAQLTRLDSDKPRPMLGRCKGMLATSKEIGVRS